MAIIYAATNKSLKGNPVKIGITSKSIESRMQGLNTGVPEPYDCFCALEVGDKARQIEKLVHNAFKKSRTNNGEFFKLEKDSVSDIFLALQISGDYEDVTPYPEDTVDKEEHKRVVERRKNFTFGEVGIEKGTMLQFKGDDEITCEVVDDKKVLFRGEETSLSNSAAIILKEMGSNRKNEKAVAGTLYWYYKGKSLDEWRG